MKISIGWLIILFSLASSTLLAQNATDEDSRKKAAFYFIEGYNEQNYSKMTKNWFGLAHFLPVKKGLKEQFEPRYRKYGKAEVSKIILKGSRVFVHLHYLSDTTKNQILVINFNQRNKIEGLGFTSPTFRYPQIIHQKITYDEIKNRDIDQLVNKEYLNGHFNGNVLVLRNNEVLYKRSLGFSNYEKKTLLSDSSIFYLASCSKQFTAMAIMILYEQGKLKFTDAIQQFIPELPYQNITIEHLLRHTSGLPDYMELMEKHWDKQKIADNEDVIKMMVKYKPRIEFYPGEFFGYSNTGYVVLAVVIEKCSGMKYSDFMQKYIFSPLQMKTAFIGGAGIEVGSKTPNWAYGHIFLKKENKYVLPETVKENLFYLDSVVGDGNVNLSLLDLIQWENGVFNNRLISKQTLEMAYSNFVLKSAANTNYGFGYFLTGGENEEKVVWHSGGWTGYHTFMLRLVDPGISIIILSNNEYPEFTELADEMVKVILR